MVSFRATKEREIPYNNHLQAKIGGISPRKLVEMTCKPEMSTDPNPTLIYNQIVFPPNVHPVINQPGYSMAPAQAGLKSPSLVGAVHSRADLSPGERRGHDSLIIYLISIIRCCLRARRFIAERAWWATPKRMPNSPAARGRNSCAGCCRAPIIGASASPPPPARTIHTRSAHAPSRSKTY